ncbi:hypothetical protein TRFO_05480 [Tritrichomonas foetus]|uniref:Uncharacterized protein n=1 Tax=Tritrichomonas foetus TaxID=1144522 RepID=A0A1J4K7C5_9EUKA|nr:hypothetical protein TRFO_05480 [Tritrichomonas foetus]|eukprot:OHT06784.1 hypothetical protein TRFO_05480 [Tritrichomonas foetus]
MTKKSTKRFNSTIFGDPIDDQIEDFLRRPIDSYFDNEIDEFESHNSLKTQPTNSFPRQLQVTVKPSNFNNVLFDWESTIKKISHKLQPERIRPKSRGLPNIALREIQKENEALYKNKIEGGSRSEIREKKVVYPLRKNELPMLRKAPGLLNPPKPRRRFD